ncbi:MAG: hypothetical protein KJ799_04920 [Bacteroidetes bacterium]|nr:hypothetical protein [Bacteroidota bacterium]
MSKYIRSGFIFVVGFIISCSNPTNPTDSSKLFYSSFEQNEQPDSSQWKLYNLSHWQFVSDTPPTGGKWALELEAEWGPVQRITTTIPLLEGSHKYRIAWWGKAIGFAGGAELYTVTVDTSVLLGTVQVTDSDWRSYMIDMIVEKADYDSLLLSLDGGFSHLVEGKTYFDLVSIQLDPLNN